ncbi:MAG: hypothetical protein JWO86_875 [Myxococcaceae bacterium]|nr:hypothetical protein [Myxococcaceae bacterium]
MRGIAFVVALAVGCGAGEASRREAASPHDGTSDGTSDGTVVPRPEMPPPVGNDDALDGSAISWSVGDAALHVPAPAALPAPSFGAIESVKPGDVHAFRLAVALRSARASASGAKVTRMLSVIPEVIDAKRRTGIDPFADGEWLLVYGTKVAVPGPNANVVKHGRAEGELTKTMADGGFEAWDAGAPSTSTSPPSAATANAVRAEIYGVNDVVLRPQPGIVAVVPGDRARDLAVALAKPIDLGVKPGELARAFVAEPAKLLRFLPAEVVHAHVIVKAAPDGGLDASADADCLDAAQCKATAAAVEELSKSQNSLVVRIVTKNLLGGLVVRADGTKLKATLHAAPDQVDAALNLLRSQLGLPGDHTYAGP